MGKLKKTEEKKYLSELEKSYSEHYQAATGVPMTMAKKFIKSLISQIVKESKKEGTYNLPPDFGKKMLEQEPADKKVAKYLKNMRKEGVTDDDIISWWGMHDIERRLLVKLDETNRTGLFLKLTNFDKLPVSEANTLVLNYHPIYGEPVDTAEYKGENRPIPPELRKRVNLYAEKECKLPVKEQQKKFDRFNSLNARIRHEIKAGNL